MAGQFTGYKAGPVAAPYNFKFVSSIDIEVLGRKAPVANKTQHLEIVGAR